MRKILMAALAASMLTPVAASAQEWRHDRQEMRQDRREVQGDMRRGDWREARHDRRELRDDRRDLRDDHRDMREDRREDWRDYRASHRDAYRMNRYVGPRGHVYRSVTPGYRFAPGYYDRRYWISDPWAYRLPAAGLGLKWVRYGNDVVLINLRTGRVVQVYNSFFW